MNRRQALGAMLSGAAAGSGLSMGQPPAVAKRPNILFLMTDEHRFDCVGYTNPFVQTPNLTRLAAESVVFSNAYTTSPSCVPARAAIYTGRYPSQCGAPTYITYLPRTETTFMSRLQKAGYYTAAIGKQHFGDTTIERGYDHMDLVDFLETGSKKLRKPASRFASTWIAAQKDHIDDYVGEKGRLWMEKSRPAAKPWFLTVSFHGPHQPFDGLGLKYEKQYAAEKIELPRTNASDLAGKPPHFQDHTKLSPGLTEQEIRQMRLAYYSKISMIDDKIGGILAALRASGEYDNTLIVFCPDHGDFMGDFGLVYKAQYLSEVLMRIPMLAKPPLAGFQGRKEKAFVQNFDIGPTCLALAGAGVPAEMSAEDLSKFWRDPDNTRRRSLCFMDGQALQGVRDASWKLVHYRDRAYGELYNLERDPWEKQNLWDDPAAAKEKARLQNHLVDHLIGIARGAEAEWNTGAPKI